MVCDVNAGLERRHLRREVPQRKPLLKERQAKRRILNQKKRKKRRKKKRKRRKKSQRAKEEDQLKKTKKPLQSLLPKARRAPRLQNRKRRT